MNIKQREDETLRSYITHFNKEALSINEVDDKILVAAFTNGLRKGKFLCFPIQEWPENYVGCAIQGDQVHKRRRCVTGSRREAQEEGKVRRPAMGQGAEDG